MRARSSTTWSRAEAVRGRTSRPSSRRASSPPFRADVQEPARRRLAHAADRPCREHGMKLWIAFGRFPRSLGARWCGLRRSRGHAQRRSKCCGRRARGFDLPSIFATVLAEAEMTPGQLTRHLLPIDAAIADTELDGQRWFDAETPSHPRRDFAEARSGEYRASRGSFPHRHRHRATAEGAELRVARGAVAGEALSIDPPRRRRPCRARSGARRLFADAGISRDRASASAACRARRNRRTEKRRRGAPTPA